MTPAERRKAIETAVAQVVNSRAVPADIRLGIAALAEEVAELRSQLADVKATLTRGNYGDGDRKGELLGL